MPIFKPHLKKRRAGTGIDWYRYRETILKGLLLPFAKDLAQTPPHVIVQEDKAPAHNAKEQQKVFDA